ncbi:flavin monoamine oxidase family protein [Actinoplanes regularis]|uniref:flavin monoamine oxidase family protein n=1 Tax=Actinoplanes regularis TaxID=52697 RepID=UPI002555A4DC|nr:FAD-dependent oxidoreductase [Actinoplanes regularis]GLW27807.1 hypothetical protein Areg01_07470 [Actinoplanes regularis]
MSTKVRLLGSAVSHWGDDPWARGSWSLIGRDGSRADRIALGAPIDDRLRIVGEATHPTRAGMTHGAYEQGLAAAAWAADLGHRRVAVVGAGMAGLGAARTLHDLGRDILIWEARDRIGGRTAGVEVAGGTFDLGANWLQQYEENTLARLAERLGLTVVPTDFNDPLVFNGEPNPDGIEDDLRKRLAAAAPGSSVADVRREWLSEPAPWTRTQIRRLIDAEIVMDAGAPLDWLSAREGFEPGVGEGDRWIVGGYRLLTRHLAEGLKIHLNHPVSHVRVTADGVVLTGADTTLQVDAAIVTAPLPVLAAGGITFDPPLPETHRTALSRLGAGRVEKVILRFDRRFWPEHGYYRIHGPTDTGVSEWLDATRADGTPTLVGLFAGAWLDEIWTGTDDEIAARAARIVRSVVPEIAG